MKIYIVRHGDPDYSIDSLTEKGWREAELLSERMKQLPIDDFYCYPLGRAKDTLKPTIEKVGKTFEILPWLREFEGHKYNPVTQRYRVSWDIPPSIWCNEPEFYTFDKWQEVPWMAETTAATAYPEVTAGIDELLSRYGWTREGMAFRGGEDKTIALFCHFGLGSLVMGYLLGIPPVVAQNSFFLSPTSVTTLVTETDGEGYSHFRATGVGDISHLYMGGEPMSESGLYPNFQK